MAQGPSHTFTHAYQLTAVTDSSGNPTGEYIIGNGASTSSIVYDNINNSYTDTYGYHQDNLAQLGDVGLDEFTVNNTTLGAALAGYHGDNPDGSIVAFVPGAPAALGTKFFLFSDTPETVGGTVTPSYAVPYDLACFASGTKIGTARGEVAVEQLVPGDIVITSCGAHRPIKWLGHRTINCRCHPRPHEAQPIRISAHAFGENRPSRDLYVSPGHAICVDILGEVLVPAISLVNGSTISQVELEMVTYWHVELDSHDILLAENLPAESYLDMGNRGFFAESGIVDLEVTPDVDPAMRTPADFCRPFFDGGPLIDALRHQLRARAEASGWVLRHDNLSEVHLVVDGKRIEPVWRDRSACFALPHAPGDVWLMSGAARPCDVQDSGDSRVLGLSLSSMSITTGFETCDIALDDPRLADGFHGVEQADDWTWRWTNGRARLPSELWANEVGPTLLRIDLGASAMPRWEEPTARFAHERGAAA